MQITKEEAQRDLEATNKDIERLELLTEALRWFINDSGGEYRAHLKGDLLRYQAYLQQAKNLKVRIVKALEGYGAKPEECSVYSHPDCIFNYCPYPDSCKPNGCISKK